MDKEASEQLKHEWSDAAKAQFDVKTLNIIGNLDDALHPDQVADREGANTSISSKQFNG